jgi:HSP20 family protein
MAMERWRQFGSTDRWEPFRVVDIQGEVNRLFDNFFGRPATAATPSGRAWLPAVDMHETANDLVLKVELPGVQDKDVTVSITGDLLTIKGERRWSENEARDQKLLHVERVYGQFERMIQLPMAVQSDKVKASYRDGVLEITLPKAEELKPREIKIDIL